MKEYPALISVMLSYRGTVTYCENLCYREEPTEDDAINFVKFIRPTTQHDLVVLSYQRKLKQKEL